MAHLCVYVCVRVCVYVCVRVCVCVCVYAAAVYVSQVVTSVEFNSSSGSNIKLKLKCQVNV